MTRHVSKGCILTSLEFLFDLASIKSYDIFNTGRYVKYPVVFSLFCCQNTGMCFHFIFFFFFFTQQNK